MKKSDLVYSLSNASIGLSVKTVDQAVKEIIEYMSDALEHGKRIEIRGFGSFSLHHRKGRIGRNPKTGETISIAEKYVPFFKTSKELKAKVDSK